MIDRVVRGLVLYMIMYNNIIVYASVFNQLSLHGHSNLNHNNFAFIARTHFP